MTFKYCFSNSNISNIKKYIDVFNSTQYSHVDIVLNVNILKSAILIGIVTFILSAIGIKIGNIFGNKYERRAKIVGGIILIVIGFKTLIEHIM